ncbi:MAG TPA: GNAT family N-acetyltransferase [Acidimicrobiales bacterium]|nr:GNAT family N-acetyltransferase [Acidimicrobiales bacterium]
MRVRQATSGDTHAIAEISVRSWQVGYAGQVPQAYLDGLKVTHRGQAIQAMLARSSGPSRGFFVAENTSGRVLGFANVRPSEENLGSGEGELQALYVHPDFWRQGVGSELMRAGLQLLRSEGKVEAVLWVLDTNDRARRFYENRDWRPDEATRPIVIAEQRLVEVRYRRTLAH